MYFILLGVISVLVVTLAYIRLNRPIPNTIRIVNDKHIKPSSTPLLILGVVKDVEDSFGESQKCLVKTLKSFPKSRIIIYENNSEDGTKRVLRLFENSDPRVTCLCDHVKDSQMINLKSRMGKIAYARNQVLSYCKEKNLFHEYPCTVWIDMDGGIWDIASLHKTLHLDHHWDAIMANNHNKYYDAYALRNDEYPFGPEIDDTFWVDIENGKRHGLYKEKDKLIPVWSAFSGLAIYKSEIFNKCTYEDVVTEEVVRTYNMIAEESKYKKDIEYINNSGYNFPVICEHVSLHFQMIQKGYDDLYIYTDLYYQR